MVYSFPPIISQHPIMLILGTMPGVASLEKKQYYAHPQNVFWKILCAVFNEEFSLDYSKRLQLINDHNLAVWDTLKLCTREGSLDKAIKNEYPNNISTLIDDHPTIQKILCNGQLAGKYLKKHNIITKDVQVHVLPSTSPANAGMKYKEKLTIWTKALNS